MKTVVFVPVNAGAAHIVRSLAVAERLNNCKCVMIVEPKRFKLITSTRKLPGHIKLFPHEADHYDDPIFLEKVWKGKYPEDLLLGEIDFYLKAIKRIKPDVIVADSNPFGFLTGFALNIPVVEFGTLVSYPYQAGFAKLTKQKHLQKGIDTLMRPISNKLILDYWKRFYKVYKQKGLHDFEEGYKGFMNNLNKVLFDDPKYANLLPNVPNLHFFPLPISIYERGDKKEFEELKRRLNGKRTVYITLGGTGYSPQLVKRLVTTFLDAGYFVLCSTAQITDPKELPKSDSLYAAKFIPGYAATILADVVISHGSQGTRAHAEHSKTPLLAIPFNLEQYLALEKNPNPLVQNLMPLSLRETLRATRDFKWLTERPNILDMQEVLATAAKIPSKGSECKIYPAPNKADREVADYILSLLD